MGYTYPYVLKNSLKISLSPLHFDINKFESEKNLRKEKNTIFEKSPII